MRRVAFLIIAMFIMACTRNSDFIGPNTIRDTISKELSDSLIIIGCEGNFQFENASLDVINLKKGVISNDAFFQANEQRVGDVLQSIEASGDTLLMVVNNTGVIRLLNRSTLSQIGLVEGLNSPRYMTKLPNSKLLVTSLFGDVLYVIDLSTLAIDLEVRLNGWNEGVYYENENFWVHNRTHGKLYALNQDFELTDSINIEFEAAFSTALDSKLFFLGDLDNVTYLSYYDIETGYYRKVVLTETMAGLAVSANYVYTVSSHGVYRHLPDLSQSVYLFDHSLVTPYGFSVHEQDKFFVLNDALDYVSKGDCYLYDSQGHLNEKFKTGVIPQATLFTF